MPVDAELRALIELGYLREIDDYVDITHTYNGKFRRLAWDNVSPTVDTHFGNASLFLHPDEHRPLSAREAARIQGFSDSFGLTGSRTQKFRLIGNAVPPPMAERIGRFVRQALF
jgi:DNA (cytosine-5)-methyltransferase 1